MSWHEILPEITSDDGTKLSASYTANNGIRLGILDGDFQEWAEFDFSPDQAKVVGKALLRWGGAND